MLSKKILLDYSEFQRLKSIEKKYGESKKVVKMEADQSGSGSSPGEDSLAKIILTNENALVAPPQEILNPITAAPPLVDPGSVSIPHPIAGPSRTKDSDKERKPKREENNEPLPKNWWYIGKPKNP